MVRFRRAPLFLAFGLLATVLLAYWVPPAVSATQYTTYPGGTGSFTNLRLIMWQGYLLNGQGAVGSAVITFGTSPDGTAWNVGWACSGRPDLFIAGTTRAWDSYLDLPSSWAAGRTCKFYVQYAGEGSVVFSQVVIASPDPSGWIPPEPSPSGSVTLPSQSVTASTSATSSWSPRPSTCFQEFSSSFLGPPLPTDCPTPTPTASAAPGAQCSGAQSHTGAQHSPVQYACIWYGWIGYAVGEMGHFSGTVSSSANAAGTWKTNTFGFFEGDPASYSPTLDGSGDWSRTQATGVVSSTQQQISCSSDSTDGHSYCSTTSTWGGYGNSGGHFAFPGPDYYYVWMVGLNGYDQPSWYTDGTTSVSFVPDDAGASASPEPTASASASPSGSGGTYICGYESLPPGQYGPPVPSYCVGSGATSSAGTGGTGGWGSVPGGSADACQFPGFSLDVSVYFGWMGCVIETIANAAVSNGLRGLLALFRGAFVPGNGTLTAFASFQHMAGNRVPFVYAGAAASDVAAFVGAPAASDAPMPSVVVMGKTIAIPWTDMSDWLSPYRTVFLGLLVLSFLVQLARLVGSAVGAAGPVGGGGGGDN